MRTFLLSVALMGVFVAGVSRADDWHRGVSRSGVGFSISYGDGRDRFSASWGRGSSRGFRDHDYDYHYGRGPSHYSNHHHSHTGFYSPYPVYSVPVYSPGFYSVPSYGGWHSHGRHCR